MKIKTNSNKKYLALAAMCLVLGACATQSITPDGTGLSVADERLNDLVLHADNAVFDETEKRLFELIHQGNPVDSYFMSKARAWLVFAMDEHRENEIDGTDNLALAQAQLIISDLEQGRTPSMQTPLINNVPRLREDLWSVGEGLKSSGDLACVEQQVAKLEVQLVWVGHEYGEMGWRHAEPYVRIAEQLNYEINSELDNCNAQTQQADVTQATLEEAKIKTSVPVSVIKQPGFLVPDRVHFEFDRYDLLPDAETILGFVVMVLEQNPDTVVELLGFSDERGGSAYNKRLSQKRADAVRAWLLNAGIAPERLRASGQGEIDVHTTVNKQHKYDRRVEIRVTSTRLTEQL